MLYVSTIAVLYVADLVPTLGNLVFVDFAFGS